MYKKKKTKKAKKEGRKNKKSDKVDNFLLLRFYVFEVLNFQIIKLIHLEMDLEEEHEQIHHS